MTQKYHLRSQNGLVLALFLGFQPGGLEETIPQSKGHSLGLTMQGSFPEHIPDMVADGEMTDIEPSGNGVGRQPSCQ